MWPAVVSVRPARLSGGQRLQAKEALVWYQQGLVSGESNLFLSCISLQFVGSQADQRKACCMLQRIKRGPVPGLVPTSTMVQSGCVSTWPSALENHVSGLHGLEAGNCSRQAGRQAGCRPDSMIEHCCKLGHAVLIVPDA